MYQSVMAHPLVNALPIREHTVFVVAFNRRNQLTPANAELIEQWRLLGGDVTVDTFRHEEAWWFTEDIRRLDNTGIASLPLITLTANWLSAQFSDQSVAPGAGR
jgi:hypothetical protein